MKIAHKNNSLTELAQSAVCKPANVGSILLHRFLLFKIKRKK